jgi:hypothetical protein
VHHADCLNGLFRRRKRVAEVSEAFRRLRACYPRRGLFVIMDGLRNVHDHPRFLALLRRLRIQPVPTPTEASWLNLIEAQFGVLKRFTSRWPTPTIRATGCAGSELPILAPSPSVSRSAAPSAQSHPVY